MFISKLDDFLLNPPKIKNLKGIKLFFIDFLFFGIKEIRSCLFPAAILLALLLIPKIGIWGIPRYDILLIYAVIIQIGMLFLKLESMDEFKTICLFHLLGFCMEVFKVSASIQSWSYPEFAYSKYWVFLYLLDLCMLPLPAILSKLGDFWI